jgi:hypothetical protein
MVYNTIKAWGVVTTNVYNVLVRSRRQGKAWGVDELTPGMLWSAVEDRQGMGRR